MSKITFEDKSFVECRKSESEDKILLIISATDSNNKNKKITNAVEISREEFDKLISDIK